VNNFIQSLKPELPRRYLLFIAALVWTFAGGMLLYKGGTIFLEYNHLFWSRLICSAIGGLLFYLLLFSKISFKHTRRIVNLKNDNPCAFSFFDLKSYIVMTVMITSGILLRKSDLLAPEYLSILYITMGIPLFLSAFRFYYYGIFYDEVIDLRE
jgi:hypothetical protein